MKACNALFIAALFLFGMSAVLYAEAPAAPPPYGNRSVGGSSGGGRSSSPGSNKMPWMYLGLLMGTATPPNTTSRLGLGATGGVRLSQSFSLGVFLLYSSQSQNTGYPVPYDKNTLSLLVYGGEFNFIAKFWDYFLFRSGVRAGPSKITLDSSGLRSASTHVWGYGPSGSLDIFIRKEVSIGVDATLLLFGDPFHYTPYITTYINGSLKLWF